MAGYTDNCFVVNFSLSRSSFSCTDIGVQTVMLTASDRKGNRAICEAKVTVEDNIGPTVFCKNMNLMLDGSGKAGIAPADALAAVSDACGSVMLSLVKTDFSCADAGTNEVILTATDTHGNSSSCSAMVTVVGNPAIANDLPETCNGRDDNCNGEVDEDFDQDADGFTSCGGGNSALGDCDDHNAGINPTVPEQCNGLDDNCNGQVDEDFDADGDGHTPCGGGSAFGDCNDADPNVHPGSIEVCNGKDEDCNGLVDEGLSGVPYLGNITFTDQAQVDAWRPCYGIIQGNLIITGLDITDLEPLSNITSVTGDVVIKFTKLANLHGLESFIHIGHDLEIQNNGWLTTLDGLQNLSSVHHNLGIFQNQRLMDCCAIYALLNGTGVAGAKSVFFNDTGCDNSTEINVECGSSSLIVRHKASIGKLPVGQGEMELLPNPAIDEVTVRFLGLQGQAVLLAIYDQLDKAVLKKDFEEGQDSMDIKLSDGLFKDGIYLVNAEVEGRRLAKRLVVVKR